MRTARNSTKYRSDSNVKYKLLKIMTTHRHWISTCGRGRWLDATRIKPATYELFDTSYSAKVSNVGDKKRIHE